MKNLNKKAIFSLIVLLSFGPSMTSAEESTQEKALAIPTKIVSTKIVVETTSVEAPATLNICDHNGDDVRNLIDVAMFATCKDTFDVNGDGIHDLADISEYATNNQDNTWCAEKFGPKPTVVAPVTSAPATLNICDHNGDDVRNLIDVAMFATCKDTFDVNGDGIHDLADISEYATNNQDNTWCATEFVCEAVPVVEAEPQVSSGVGVTFAIRSLESEVSCENFDISWKTTKYSDTILNLGTEAGIYTENIVNETNTKTHSLELVDLLPNTTYFYQVSAISSNGREIELDEKSFTTEQCEVLGEKIKVEEELIIEDLPTCKYGTLDVDVLGQTGWEDGTLLRACGPEVYIIENQKKRHIKNLSELFNYIGQRIYNVKNSVLDLF